MNTVVVGLDASLDRMGWAIVDGETGAPGACGVESIRPEGTPDIQDAGRPPLIRDALRVVSAAVGRADVLAVYVEMPWIGPNRQTSTGLLMAAGSVWQAASRMWPDAALGFVEPMTWRKECGVPNVPLVPGSRKRIGKVEQRAYALELGNDLPASARVAIHRMADKPLAMLRAYQLGFDPNGSQDAADAVLIATTGRILNTRICD